MTIAARASELLQEWDAASSGQRLRSHRAVAVLEYISDPQSVELLHRLASGAPAAALSREAKAALERKRPFFRQFGMEFKH
jgi:hypothetical protein